MRVIEVDGIEFEEIQGAVVAAMPRGRRMPKEQSQEDAAFIARMSNWRKVVMGPTGDGGTSQYCAGWAKLYVHLRVSEAAPAEELLAEKIKPLSPLVSADELDGWLVEAAWRTLGDYNERQALKSLYIYRWPADQIRRFLHGVRGRHVQLVIAKAERNLHRVLAQLESVEAIRCHAAPWDVDRRRQLT